MKEVQGTSTVEYTSLKSTKTIPSSVVNENADYQVLIISNVECETTYEKNSLKSEQTAYCTQRTVKSKTHAAKNPKSEGSKSQKVIRTKKKCVLHRAI